MLRLFQRAHILVGQRESSWTDDVTKIVYIIAEEATLFEFQCHPRLLKQA